MKSQPESPPDFKPEIVLLVCQGALAQGADLETAARKVTGFKARPVVLPCTSKIDISYLIKLIEQGADAVEIVGCPPGACSFLVGTDRAQKRVTHARALLELVKMNPERIWLDRGDKLPAEQILALAEARAQAVRPLGSNPMKREKVS
jgi:coenzyme F420-reducing hydrogenase delta subunit